LPPFRALPLAPHALLLVLALLFEPRLFGGDLLANLSASSSSCFASAACSCCFRKISRSAILPW
jgi:hypothetical protein